MLKILVTALLATILIGVTPPASAKRHYTKAEVVSSETAESLLGIASVPKESHVLKLQDLELLVCHYSIGTKRQPRETLFFWSKKPDGYELVHKVESELGETFSQPVVFSASNYDFLNISTEPNGSGGFVTDQIYWFAPDGSMHPVEFHQASEVYEGLAKSDEFILTGGEKEFFYDENQMRFEFWLGRDGDPHCCPSGGTVTGTYKIVGTPKYDSFTRHYQANFQILVDQMTALRKD